MIIRNEDLHEACYTISGALDSSELSVITETLELKTEENILYMNVTNREYYVSVKIDIDENEPFHATVNAGLFLKLISQITTDTIEFIIKDKYLFIKGNGNYKIPLIFDDTELLELPIIELNNITTTFDIDSSILKSILQYNSKELIKAVGSKPVQKLYYIDNHGCITFVQGACVNSFEVDVPFSILIGGRVVKLFKLFGSEPVHVEISHEELNADICLTKMRLTGNNVCITTILTSDDSLIKTVPVNAIRGRANDEYKYSVNIDRIKLTEAISRLTLFNDKNELKPYSKFEFGFDKVTIYDTSGENKEEIYYTNTTISEPYDMILDMNNLKLTLDGCVEQYVTFNFGNKTAAVLARGNIRTVIPEVVSIG